MRILLAFMLSLGLCSVASASSGGSTPPAGGHGGGGSAAPTNRFLTIFNRSDREADADEEEAVEADPRAFTLPAVVVPLSLNGRLTGYAYVRVRVRAADGQNLWTMQERAHYALDAMVRAAARTSLATADGMQLDHALAAQVWRQVLVQYYGADAVDTVDVSGDDRRMIRR